MNKIITLDWPMSRGLEHVLTHIQHLIRIDNLELSVKTSKMRERLNKYMGQFKGDDEYIVMEFNQEMIDLIIPALYSEIATMQRDYDRTFIEIYDYLEGFNIATQAVNKAKLDVDVWQYMNIDSAYIDDNIHALDRIRFRLFNYKKLLNVFGFAEMMLIEVEPHSTDGYRYFFEASYMW